MYIYIYIYTHINNDNNSNNNDIGRDAVRGQGGRGAVAVGVQAGHNMI